MSKDLDKEEKEENEDEGEEEINEVKYIKKDISLNKYVSDTLFQTGHQSFFYDEIKKKIYFNESFDNCKKIWCFKSFKFKDSKEINLDVGVLFFIINRLMVQI
jgi:hypothetical protein